MYSVQQLHCRSTAPLTFPFLLVRRDSFVHADISVKTDILDTDDNPISAPAVTVNVAVASTTATSNVASSLADANAATVAAAASAAAAAT